MSYINKIIEAIDNNDCTIVFGTDDVEVFYERDSSKCINYKIKNIDQPDMIRKVITETVNNCVINGKVDYYFVENNVLKSIFKYYTDVAEELYSDEVIEKLINGNMVIFEGTSSIKENLAISRFKDAVYKEIDRIDQRSVNGGKFGTFIDAIFDSISSEDIADGVLKYIGEIANMGDE